MYVRGDRHTAFGHISQEAGLVYEDSDVDLINLLAASASNGMQSLLTVIGDITSLNQTGGCWLISWERWPQTAQQSPTFHVLLLKV